MPIIASCDIPLEVDEGRYLSNIKNYMELDGVYFGVDPMLKEYKHACKFDGIRCIYSAYYNEFPDYVVVAEVRQDYGHAGLARAIALDYFLENYGAIRMSVGITEAGMEMWQKLIEQAPYNYLVEARLDGKPDIKLSSRPIVYTTAKEPTTPVYMISNSRLEL